MNELDLLIQQKRELERKIRKIKELKNCAQVVGQVKIDVERYSTSLPDRYFLAVFYKPLQNSRPKWQTIFSSNNRKEVVDVIPSIISNLQELYDRNKESENG